jgi:diketogulonate reductase-like aldo/keto reductase
VLRWLTQRGVIVIPKSVRKDRTAENMDLLDFEPTTDHMARIARMDTGASLFSVTATRKPPSASPAGSSNKTRSTAP